MKQLLFLLVFTICIFQVFSQPQQKENTSQLASKYYSQKNYEKAAPLYKSLYNSSRNSHYFRMYFNCLIESKDFEKAEKEITDRIKDDKKSPVNYVYWGYLLGLQGQEEEAAQKYKLALKNIPDNRSTYLSTASAFTQFSLFKEAEETYKQGQQKLQNVSFSYELARTYYYLRDYDQMMSEYLDYLSLDEKNLERVQSSLAGVLRLDFNNELKDKFMGMTLKKVQANPNILSFNRLLIWFFLQEGKFSNALRQSIALDKRTGNEDDKIMGLANMALNNHQYKEAKNAYAYLMGKGKDTPYYNQGFILNLKASYLYFIQEKPEGLDEGLALAQQMKHGLDSMGNLLLAQELIIDYADVLAFYLHKPDEAIEAINQGLKTPGLNPVDMGRLKTKLADIYVYNEDPWEATLIYSQVIDANKTNDLGDEVKLKKARLSYFLGNFAWAKAQLDVLKASTSKLTANDAFELALFIGENTNLDTTDIPLQMFARADLYFFQNRDSLAMATIDSIVGLFPYHSLGDDILMRKAKLNIKAKQYDEAAKMLQEIVDDYAYDQFADDALFMLASVCEQHLANTEKAQELYKQLMVSFPGSIYVVEARKRFRILRGDDIEQQPELDNKDLFLEEGI